MIDRDCKLELPTTARSSRTTMMPAVFLGASLMNFASSCYHLGSHVPCLINSRAGDGRIVDKRGRQAWTRNSTTRVGHAPEAVATPTRLQNLRHRRQSGGLQRRQLLRSRNNLDPAINMLPGRPVAAHGLKSRLTHPTCDSFFKHDLWPQLVSISTPRICL